MTVCKLCGHRTFEHDHVERDGVIQIHCPAGNLQPRTEIKINAIPWKVYAAPIGLRRDAEILAHALEGFMASVKVKPTSGGKFQVYTRRKS